MAATGYADVAVPLPIPQLFTYAVPEKLEGRVKVGMRVVVPFGRRSLPGLVVTLHREERADAKPLSTVIDEAPLLGRGLIELGLWLSSYYLSPPGEAFRVMLPPGLLSKSFATEPHRSWPVRKQLAVVEVLDDAGARLSASHRQLVKRVLESGLPLLLSQARRMNLSLSSLRTLAGQQAIRIEPVEVERSPWPQAGLPSGVEVRRHVLNDQQNAVFGRIQEALSAREFRSILVHGVTGSGKTEIYLNAIQKALERGKASLLLVPEIGLTPQVASHFQAWFGERAAILHSGLSDGERFDQWRRIRAGEARVVIGTRSAVFAPLDHLGIVVVDEEQDSSYKQEETPRYHARDTALKRAQLEGAVAVLGSATPQLETYYLAARRGQHVYQRLPGRIQDRPLPVVRVVDMRVEFQARGKAAVISQELEDSIRGHLKEKQQVLVLLNRRGYAPVLLCRSCGYTEMCEQCSICLTYHQESQKLCCHFCGYTRKPPTSCRNCGREYLYLVGEGTERIAEILRELFPEARVDRLDRDTVRRRGGVARILGQFAAGGVDILVGTQMIAKGHDFPRVTLVGVLAAEQSLRLADFRAAERTFQLLTQVAGRAGRGDQPGEVVIQTYFPNHYSVKCACAQDYERFFQEEIKFRYRFRYPPFTALTNVVVSGRERVRTEQIASQCAAILEEERRTRSDPQRMRFLGPAPAPRERLRGDYRFQILVKTTSREELHDVLEAMLQRLAGLPAAMRAVSIDVDPASLV